MSSSLKSVPYDLKGTHHWLCWNGTSLVAWNLIFCVMCKGEIIQLREYNKFLKIGGIKRHHKFYVWDNHLLERSNQDVNLQLPYL